MRPCCRLLRQAATLSSPYQILGVSRGASPSEIKSAYYNLVKTHHPDLPSTSDQAEQRTTDFKDIVAAWEFLKDPSKRRAFDRYGFGWKAGNDVAGAAAGMDYHNLRNNPWGTPKSRPYRHAYQRGSHPTRSYDFGRSDSTDFFNRNPPSEGNYTSNVSFIAILSGLSVLLYSVQFWRLAPPLSSSTHTLGIDSFNESNPRDAPIWKSAQMKGRDKHHDDASSNLAAAREGAQRWGTERRNSIRRRVRESTLEAVESGRLATGHDVSSLDDLDALLASQEDPYAYKRMERPITQAHQYPAFLQITSRSKRRKEPEESSDSQSKQSAETGGRSDPESS